MNDSSTPRPQNEFGRFLRDIGDVGAMHTVLPKSPLELLRQTNEARRDEGIGEPRSA